MEGITRLCFGASYAVALGLELARLARPRPAFRAIALLFGFAGLFAQTAYLAIQRPTIQSQYGSLLFLAWVLAIFYLYGAVHHRRFAWAIFVLPVVLGLVVLAGRYRTGAGYQAAAVVGSVGGILTGEQFWGGLHGLLILLAAVGVSVGFLASVMYLVQARRLRAKSRPVGRRPAAEPGAARRDEPPGGERRLSAADGRPDRRSRADVATGPIRPKRGPPAKSLARPGCGCSSSSCWSSATACTPAAGRWPWARLPRLSSWWRRSPRSIPFPGGPP